MLKQNNMKQDIMCKNCERSYKEKERVFKKAFYKKIGKKNWCDDCVVQSDLEDEL